MLHCVLCSHAPEMLCRFAHLAQFSRADPPPDSNTLPSEETGDILGQEWLLLGQGKGKPSQCASGQSDGMLSPFAGKDMGNEKGGWDVPGFGVRQG